jgi:hypothetical protein
MQREAPMPDETEKTDAQIAALVSNPYGCDYQNATWDELVWCAVDAVIVAQQYPDGSTESELSKHAFDHCIEHMTNRRGRAYDAVIAVIDGLASLARPQPALPAKPGGFLS